MQRTLFGAHQQGQTLAEYCESRMAEMKEEIRLWPKDKMRRTVDQEVVDYLIEKYEVSCPVLRRDEAFSTDPANVQVEARSPKSTSTSIRVTGATVAVAQCGRISISTKLAKDPLFRRACRVLEDSGPRGRSNTPPTGP